MEFFEKAEVGSSFYEVYQSNMVDHDYKKVSIKYAFERKEVERKIELEAHFQTRTIEDAIELLRSDPEAAFLGEAEAFTVMPMFQCK